MSLQDYTTDIRSQIILWTHPGRPASTWTTPQGLDRLASPRIIASIAMDIWELSLSRDALTSVRPVP